MHGTTQKRISCSLYDSLELWAIREKLVKIEYEEDNQVKNTTTIIKTLQTENGDEFLFTIEGEKIQLSKILRIDGESFSVSCP